MESAAWAYVYDEKALDWLSSDMEKMLEACRQGLAEAWMSNVVLANLPVLTLDQRKAAISQAIIEKSLPPQLLPRMLHIRAALHAFSEQFDPAIEDCRRALELVRAGCPVVPGFEDGQPDLPLAVSEATALQQLGSTLQCAGKFQEAVQCLEAYVSTMAGQSEDDYCLPKACYELAVPFPGREDTKEAIRYWISRAEAYETQRLFVFPPYNSQKKALVQRMYRNLPRPK